MELAAYLPLLIQIVLGLATGIGIILVSVIFGQRGGRNPTKDRAYECGLLGEGPAQTRFAVKFYVAAMLFILFDIDIVFLIPLVAVYREMFAAGFTAILPNILFFIFVLALGLAYEIRKGAIHWDR